MSKQPSYISYYKTFSGLAFSLFAACALATGPAQALATWVGSWDYVLRHDPKGRPQAAFARLRGENDSLLWLTCARFSAEEDGPGTLSMTAAVSQKGYLGRSTPRGRSTVFWFDDGSPELGYWMYRDRVGQLATTEQVDQFVSKLSGARSLVIELSNYRYETQRSEFQFNVADTKVIAERFRQDCRDIARNTDTDQSMIR